jgi:hypothetical protein
MNEIAIRDSDHKSRCKTQLAHWISTLSSSAFLLLLLLAGPQCKKSSPPLNILPPATQEGKNTFGCKVNGEIWIPYYQCSYGTSGCDELGFHVYSSDSVNKLPLQFTLVAERSISDNNYSAFFINTYSGANITQTGNIYNSLSIWCVIGNDYHTQSLYTGSMNLTKLDTVNNIMSGTFSFTQYNSPSDSVVVTDGRFDLTFNACLCH